MPVGQPTITPPRKRAHFPPGTWRQHLPPPSNLPLYVATYALAPAMEDEDDSYGFGSFSDLFDGAPGSSSSSRAAAALDVDAMRRFWMPERLFNQLQQRQDGETGFGVKEFQHIGARFDGRAVDGGLGRVSFVHPRDVAGGGVMWLQAAKSDSNAQEKRRKLLSADARSSAALFVPLGDITGVSATSIQNTVQGVELALVDGHVLHLAFLPG